MADFPSLHDARPDIDDPNLGFDWSVRERSLSAGGVVAHFGDLIPAAKAFIEGSPALVGCIAWLTESSLLGALANVPVSVVVQKEDFLRPDPGGHSRQTEVQRAYERLSNNYARYLFPSPLGQASYTSDPTLDAVRCVGNHNSTRAPAMPRMHHKFLVRVDSVTETAEDGVDYVAMRASAVWTGSFNFSYNAGRSFENAVEIHDETIAEAYLGEFCRVAALSEPLDWSSPWVAAEWRMGT